MEFQAYVGKPIIQDVGQIVITTHITEQVLPAVVIRNGIAIHGKIIQLMR
jgi:hypothetical protein